jgi:Fe-S cluster biogenesis protein NfuA
MTMTTVHTDPQLFSKVEAAITTMRPFFEADGGDMTLVDITEDMVARVRLIGSCRDCQMREMTLKGGVEEAVRRAAPEIVAVEAYEGA